MRTNKAICHVLYLEDTPEDQRLLLEAIGLAEVPVRLQSALHAEAALRWLGTDIGFHVLLLDWNLPSVTAEEFLAAASRLRPSLPVLVLTGEPGTVDTAAAARYGVDKILAKPIDLEQWEALARVLSEFCEDARAVTL